MSKTDSELTSDEHINLLDELQVLLEKQIDFARQGNIREIEVLSKQADSLVGKISQTDILDPANPAFNKVRREQLRKLYEKLCLAITAQKADASEKLSQVRKGKKTIKTYRSHI